MPNQSNVSTLSFVSGSAPNLNLWPETQSLGSYAADNDAGRARAEEVVAYMRDRRAPMILGHITQAIVASGRWGALEIGFFNHIALFTVLGTDARPPATVEPAPTPRRCGTLKLAFAR